MISVLLSTYNLLRGFRGLSEQGILGVPGPGVEGSRV